MKPDGRKRKKAPEHEANVLAAVRTPEYRQRMSEIVRARGPEWKARMSAARLGKVHSEETRRKIGAAHVGMKRSDETKANISAAKAGKCSEAMRENLSRRWQSNRGAKRSPETCARITAGKKARWSATPPDERRQHMAAAVEASRHARPSSIELAVRGLLTELGIEFKPEYRIGPYLVDVFVPAFKLAIECDGEYWHRNTTERDQRRDRYMEGLGYRVLRLPERQVRSGEFKSVVLEAVS
jgi:very-short-patch-repair endonuclease